MTNSFLDHDDKLLALLASDDEHAIVIMFDQYHLLLTEVIGHYVANADEANDIIHDLFMNVWQKRHTLNLTKPLVRYLIRAALNRTRNHLRNKRRAKERSMDPNQIVEMQHKHILTTADSTMNVADIRFLLTEAKRRMSPRMRMIFMLSRNNKMTYLEIAHYMGVSVKTIEKNMSQALRILREVFGPYMTITVLGSLMTMSP